MTIDTHQRLLRIARHAADAVELANAATGPEARAEVAALRRFDPAAAAQPTHDLYLRLRALEHACGRSQPALVRRLRRLGRLAERGL